MTATTPLHFDGPPEPLLQECRSLVDRKASSEEYDHLLAVSQVLGRLRYNKDMLQAFLGGPSPMIESPFFNDLVAERMHKSILRILNKRFGPVAPELAAKIQLLENEEQLDTLLDHAVMCPNLSAFASHELLASSSSP
jgi:hypothetical protein